MGAGVAGSETFLVGCLCRCFDMVGAVGATAGIDGAVPGTPEVILPFFV